MKINLIEKLKFTMIKLRHNCWYQLWYFIFRSSYTQNQYGTQYHLLETLILNDNPSVSKVTGSRQITPLKSDWSINFKSHIAFNEVIKKTQAKHIIFSYSPDGFISKEFISQTLKR